MLWRSDIDALEFEFDDTDRRCFVHRLAFRAGLGRAATPEACQTYFTQNRQAFAAAARTKVERKALSEDARFHLTSRDIAAAIEGHVRSR